MPDFSARIRTDYRDVDGLVLDCRHDGLASGGQFWLNSAPPARALFTGAHSHSTMAYLRDDSKYWRENALAGSVVFNITDGSSGVITENTGTTAAVALAGGSDNVFDNGDQYAITTMRFGNLYQDDADHRPSVSTVGDYLAATFARANGEFMKLDIPYDYAPSRYNIIADVAAINWTSADQAILDIPNFKFRARNSSGYYEYEHNGTKVAGPNTLSPGVWMIAPSGAAVYANVFFNNGVHLAGGSYSYPAMTAGAPAGYVGCIGGSDEFLDASLRHLCVWERRLCPLERDFVHDTFSPGNPLSDEDRMAISREVWTDDTDGDSKVRINPRQHVIPRYLLATGGEYARIQVAASVNGRILPDDDLDSRLFTWDVVEHPGISPAMYQDGGWSAVADIAVNATGHYTVACTREDGGMVFVHFDAEVS
jgi:hypothetical protein